jgi:hypothetical protein
MNLRDMISIAFRMNSSIEESIGGEDVRSKN